MNEDVGHDRPDPDDSALRVLAARLGTRAADRLDVEAVGHAVVRRLGGPDVVPLGTRIRRASPGWLRLAATLVLLVGASAVARRMIPRGASTPPLVTEELTGLGVEQLTELLGSLDETLKGAAAPADSTLDDLDAEQLERVLQSLEG